MANDISTRPLLVQPYKNLHYISNAGFLLGYDDRGRFFKDDQEVLQYLKKRKCGYCTGLGDYFFLKTVMGRGMYGVFHKNQTHFDGTKKWVRTALQQIQDTCDKNTTKCMFFLIPFVNQDIQKDKSIQSNFHLFEGFSYQYPENFEKNDYCEPPNNHFNNQGHKKYADFIIGVLKQKGFDKK